MLVRKILHSKLVQSTFLFGLFSFLNKGFSFLLLILLARYLSVSDYGSLNLYNTFVTLVGFVIALNTNGYLPTIFFKNSKGYVCRIINVIFIVSFFVYVILSLVILSFPNISRYIGIAPIFVQLSLLISLFQVVFMLVLDIWRLEDKIASYGLFSIVQVILNLFLTISLIVNYGYGWEARVYAQVIIGGLIFVSSIILLYRKGYIKLVRIKKNDFQLALSFGIPLIPHSISSWIRQGIDRYIINAIYPVSIVGIYSLSFNIANIIHVVGLAFNAVNSVYIYKVLSNEEKPEKKLGNQLLLMMYCFFFFTIIVVSVSYFLIPIVFPKYNVSLSCLIPLCVSAMLQSIYYLFVNYLFYFNKTKQLMLITLCSSLIHFILSIFLIQYSFLWAAYINLFSTALILILVVWYVQRIYSLDLWNRQMFFLKLIFK